MNAHIIAVDTYGAQRVTAPQTGKRVSAYKLGYTSAVSAVLLALCGERARDVSPKQASYRYIQFDDEMVVRHGHILLTLTAAELAKAEQITRQSHRAGIFLWRDKKWWTFPNSSHPDYTEPGYQAGPNFDPMGFRPPSPSTGERETTISGINAEKSQRSASEKPWWWLSGETYPHRELLKRHGARFSGRRKQWYFIGAELPAAIQALVTSETQLEDAAPAAQLNSPLLAIFGGQIIGKERGSNDDLIVKGENGVFATRTTWIDPQEQHKTVWKFDLPPQERIGNPLPTIQQALQTNGALYSLYTRQWHFEQPDKVDALDRLAAQVPFSEQSAAYSAAVPAMSPTLAAMIEQTLAKDDEQSQEKRDTSTPVDPVTAIRVTKPTPFPAEGEARDAVQSAIQQAKHTPSENQYTAAPIHNPVRVVPIAQAYCGELTGSITGQVFCYGFAIHEGTAIYINMAGPRMAVEAIRAKLSKGDIVSVVPEDGPSVELTAGEGNSGMYHPYLHYLPEARFASLILVHEWAVTPNYGGVLANGKAATTFIFRTSDVQAMTKLRHHVTQLVRVPVFEVWSAYLYEAGQHALLVRKARSAGGIDLLSIDLDVDAWTRLITGGLEQSVIALPDSR